MQAVKICIGVAFLAGEDSRERSAIVKAVLEFSERKGAKAFFARDFPDIVNVVVWEASKGDVAKFLEVFEGYEIRDPVLVGDWGACIPLGSMHYCYLVEVERRDREAPRRITEEELGEAEARAVSKIEALAEELVGELLKHDPRELARNIVSELRSRGAHALRAVPLATRHQLRDYIMKSKKVEGLSERELVELELKLSKKLYGFETRPEVMEFLDRFEEEFAREVTRIKVEERKEKLKRALEICSERLREHGIYRPKRTDIERCVIENKLDLTWSEREALRSAIKERLRLS